MDYNNSMPGFIYTIIFFTIALWSGLLYIGNKIAPDTLQNIFVFLAFMYLTLGVTISLPIYFLLHRKAATYTNLRKIYRNSLKWSFFVSFGIVGTLGLKAFDLINPLNYGLFLLLYFVTYMQIKQKKR